MDRPEVTEHAIIHRGAVGVPTKSAVLPITGRCAELAAQLADRVLRHRKGFVVGGKRATLMRRAGLHTDLRRFDFVVQRFGCVDFNISVVGVAVLGST